MCVGVDMALVAVFNGCSRKSGIWCSSTWYQYLTRRSLIYLGSEEAYGPKSDGVAPPGSLGGGGRFMRVGPEDLDISCIPGRMNISGSRRLAARRKNQLLDWYG